MHIEKVNKTHIAKAYVKGTRFSSLIEGMKFGIAIRLAQNLLIYRHKYFVNTDLLALARDLLNNREQVYYKFDKETKEFFHVGNTITELNSFRDDIEFPIDLFKDKTDKAFISTVFLGIDHNFHKDDDPILFETMVFFKDGREDLQYRWKSYYEAKKGHEKLVKIYKDE